MNTLLSAGGTHRAGAMLIFAFVFGVDQSTATEPIVIASVFVKLIQEVEIPVRHAGVLDHLEVREGDPIKAGEVLAHMADAEAMLAVRRAKAQSMSAEHQANDTLAVDQAKKKLDKERQAAKQRALENESAQRQAENGLRVQAAEKARDVARNEVERARRSRAQFVDSVSQSELDSLQLVAERAAIDAQQAVFERGLDRLKASALEEAQKYQQLSIEQAEVEVQQAQSLQSVARYNAELREVELEAAQVHLDQHRIHAPRFGGVVAEVYRQEGEWLQPGDSLVRVLRLDRLRVEAFLPMQSITFPLANARAELHFQGQGQQTVSAEGLVVFVKPELDSVNQEVNVWVEFENPDMLIKPGMQGKMSLVPGKSSSETTEP